MWVVTHHFVFWEYEIEYEFADDPTRETRKLLSTPWQVAMFGDVRTGFAHVRQGFFGLALGRNDHSQFAERPASPRPRRSAGAGADKVEA